MLPARIGFLSAQPQARACSAGVGVFCRLNNRQIVSGRPYLVPGVGYVELAQVRFPGRFPILSYLLDNDRPIAIWRLRRIAGDPILFRTVIERGNTVRLPWRLS
jgi:hypothetical protein